MAQGILSKGIKFSYATYSGGTVGAYTQVDGLQEIPSLGGSVDKVEVTCLADAERKYIKGIRDYGDMDFKFLFDNSSSTSNYRALKELEDDDKVSIKVEIPADVAESKFTTFTFDAQVSVAVDSAAVNAAMTFTASCALLSTITVTNPA